MQHQTRSATRMHRWHCNVRRSCDSRRGPSRNRYDSRHNVAHACSRYTPPQTNEQTDSRMPRQPKFARRAFARAAGVSVTCQVGFGCVCRSTTQALALPAASIGACVTGTRASGKAPTSNTRAHAQTSLRTGHRHRRCCCCLVLKCQFTIAACNPVMCNAQRIM